MSPESQALLAQVGRPGLLGDPCGAPSVDKEGSWDPDPRSHSAQKPLGTLLPSKYLDKQDGWAGGPERVILREPFLLRQDKRPHLLPEPVASTRPQPAEIAAGRPPEPGGHGSDICSHQPWPRVLPPEVQRAGDPGASRAVRRGSRQRPPPLWTVFPRCCRPPGPPPAPGPRLTEAPRSPLSPGGQRGPPRRAGAAVFGSV